MYEKMFSYQLQNTTWPIRFGSTPSGDKDNPTAYLFFYLHTAESISF